MTFNRAIVIVAASSCFLISACTGSQPTVTTTANGNQAVVVNANSAAAASSGTNANANAAPAINAAPPANVAANSPGAVAAQYYQAMVKKDEMAFRQTLSQPTLREFAAFAKEENAKSLVDYWTGFSSPAKRFQIRNEQIQGDAAFVEIANDENVFTKHKLVRENNQWKLDLTEATTSKLSN